MTIRLSGWQRLWIVVSILYLVAVVVFAILWWPTNATTGHRDEFISRMPNEARTHVVASYASEWSAREDPSGHIHEGFPNGAVLVIRGTPDSRLAAIRKKYPQYNDLSDAKLASALRAKFPEYADLQADSFVADEDIRKVAQAYWDVVTGATRAARRSLTIYALLGGVVPCLMLYALGWSVGWVRRGFRGGMSPPNR